MMNLRRRGNWRKHNASVLLALLTAVGLLLSGCGADSAARVGSSEKSRTESTTDSAASEGSSSDTSASESTDSSNSSGTSAAADHQNTGSVSVTWPAYAGNPVAVVNNNTPYFSDQDKAVADGYEQYSDLDNLGRCGVAYAKVGTETMPTAVRGAIGSVRPSGWHTVKYNGIIDGNYLYNRCHLLGYQLTGENANEKNLITGTRYLNVTGMLPYENLVADYVKATGHHVYYRVTPVFSGENLVADGVLMEGQSAEDNGVQFCVFAYNVEPGVQIDYKTGDSSMDSSYTGGAQGNDLPAAINNGTFTPRAAGTYSAVSGSQNPSSSQSQTGTAGSTNDGHTYNGSSYQPSASTTYILNTNTKKFHRPDCPSVKTMAQGNTKETTESRDQLIAEGYSPCKRCNP